MPTLKKHPSFPGRRGPVLLCILDGVAYGKVPEADAVAAAYTPTLDWLRLNYPHTRLKAHGTAVGMPSDEDMGNSEVGHNAIGAGRVFSQGAALVSNAIANGSIFAGDTWKALSARAQAGGTLHFIGLFSDGNVHAHVDHLRAMINQAAADGVARVRVHILLDGRDVGETSALDYVTPFEAFLAAHNATGRDYRIASGGGRMYITMDRYNADWDMVKRGWAVHVRGEGRQFASATEAIETLRAETGAIDQDLGSFVIAADGRPIGPVVDGDAVIMFNFRGDRAIELSKAFDQEELNYFDRGPRPDVLYAGMMEYDGDEHIPRHYLVNPPAIANTLGEYLAGSGVSQFAISETQKYGHVTYFFNGNRSGMFDASLEEYVEIPSDRLPFEQRPWMKAAEITDRVIAELQRGKHRFYRINFPNGDMVGHTGNFLAAQISVEATDLCLARLLPAVRKAGGVMIITADHGNADQMYELDKKTGGIQRDKDGKPKSKTSHTLNPVPCIVFDPQLNGEYQISPRTDLGITSLTATCLNLLGFEAPANYDPAVIAFS